MTKQLSAICDYIDVPVNHVTTLRKKAQTAVFIKFMLHILADEKDGVLQYAVEKKSVQNVIDLYAKWLSTGVNPSNQSWIDAAYDSSIYTANSAAYSAAFAAAKGDVNAAVGVVAYTAAHVVNYSTTTEQWVESVRNKLLSLVAEALAEELNMIKV